MALPPLRFSPILKPKVWGGRSLAGLGKRLPASEPIGESWELADLPESIPEGRSRVVGGPWDGRTLGDVLAADMPGLLGRTHPSSEGRFPLLLKYLDANDNLSVQVHPDATYVACHPEAHLKSEAWYVLAATPGSVIYAGLKPGVDRDQLAKSIEDDSVVDHLIAIDAVPGACHYLPSGTCHALGSGVLVAEVQTPSDTTFRVWDWGRTGRALHVEAALECIDFSGRPLVTNPEPPRQHNGCTTISLVDVKHFRIERVEPIGSAAMSMNSDEVPQAIMVIEGRGTLRAGEVTMDLSRGDTVLLPALRTDTTITPGVDLVLLMTTLKPAP